MARIGILTCTNATQGLGCSSVSCLRDMRKRKGAFEKYKDDEKLDLVGIINCSGCPTQYENKKHPKKGKKPKLGNKKLSPINKS